MNESIMDGDSGRGPARAGGTDCPLCGSPAALLRADRRREYRRCQRCELVFVPRAFHLSPEEEKKRYDLHRNDPSDPAYRDFLSRLVGPLARRLAPASRGLDYGCGPGPTVSVMLGEMGHHVTDYDPLYADDRQALERTYDFVVCTETAEHFCRPALDWEVMAGLVRPGGMLAVMTEPVVDPDRFERWRYKDDPTHVAFYGERTFAWIADRFALELALASGSVVIFWKREKK